MHFSYFELFIHIRPSKWTIKKKLEKLEKKKNKNKKKIRQIVIRITKKINK